ncbi:MAG: SpoIID/LytB domain-containing protein [Nitrospiraceae bacterium]
MALQTVNRQHNPFLVLILVVMATVVSGGSLAGAADSIRVLLSQDVQRMEIRAEGEIHLRRASGQERLVKAPVIVTAVGHAVAVNGVRIVADELMLRSPGGALMVTLPAFLANGTVNGIGSPQTSESKTALVVGGVVHVLPRGQGLMVINKLDLEEYVKGVVPSEVNSAWHPEVLKTQAVATRTYALYQLMLSTNREYDVLSSIQDQVYRGRHGIDRRVERAVEETRGLVVTYQNAPIYAAFSSTAAGPTEDAMNVWAKDLPYLKGVDCPFDLTSPHYQWKTTVKLETLERNLRRQGVSVGIIASVTPFAYSRAGRVTKLRILHSKGELMIRGEDLRKVVGYTIVPSTQFELELQGPDMVITGYGAGHAVGLCQWGAKELADLGYSFATILLYYYPGTELLNASLTKPPLPPLPTS